MTWKLPTWASKCWNMQVTFVAGLILLLWVFPLGLNRVYLTLTVATIWGACILSLAITYRKQFNKAQKTATFSALTVILMIYFLFVALKLVDIYMIKSIRSGSTAISRLGFMGNNDKGLELHTLQLYPYTEFHVRPNFLLNGAMPAEANKLYNQFNVQSGKHGFFIDFDLDNPPPKQQGEIRILLIGGSTAQGFGAQSNEQMLYKLLENKLNAALVGKGRHVRVVNLAMANSVTYQNYIALNRWGHALQPDFILSFSGANEMIQVLDLGCLYMPYRYHGVWGLTRAMEITETSPRWLDVATTFRGINTSIVGIALRTLRSAEIADKAQEEYRKSQSYAGMPPIEQQMVQHYVHALQSIKRDFAGIPIMVAYQPIALPNCNEPYEYLMQQSRSKLEHYMNNQWRFVDMYHYFINNGLDNDNYTTGIHLLNSGHEIVAEVLAQEFLRWFSQPPGKK